MVEDVVVQDVVIASFFFKEVAIEMRVLVVRIDPKKVTFSLILKYRLFYEGIVGPLYLCGWFDWEGTPLIVLVRVSSAKAIELLLDHFWKEGPLHDPTILKALAT